MAKRITKGLKDMSLEELWELFPIVLSPHNDQWSEWASDEIQFLSALLSMFHPVINHIGSTAIPEIQAKPIVDILVEVGEDIGFDLIVTTLESNGYICMSQSNNRLSFNKGYTVKGYADKVFHVHIHRPGDNNEIVFRDYLRLHPSKAKEYECLKMSLLPKYRNNRDGYTEAKTEFIRKIIELAKHT